MAKAVQTYQALYLNYPDGFDALVGADGKFPTYLPWDTGVSSTAPFGGFVTARVPLDAEVSALQTVGINYVNLLAPGEGSTGINFHPTMNPYPAPLTVPSSPATGQVPISTSVTLAFLNPAGVNAQNPNFLAIVRQSDPTATFVVFGVGPRCAMVGQNIQDAPTSVPQKSTFTPDTTYSRVGVIFQVSGVAVQNADNRARFICSCALEDDELESTEKDLVGYYQVSKDPRVP